MEKKFDAHYYNNTEIVSTKDIFEDYKNYNNEGCTDFPEYMEKQLATGELVGLYQYKEYIIEDIECLANRVEYNIDELRNRLDALEEVLDYEEEDMLTWKVVEVLE